MDSRFSFARDSWEKWAHDHPNPCVSVHRSTDSRQLRTAAFDVVEKLSLEESDNLLDAGCGSGVFLAEILNIKKVKASGVDFSRIHIEQARKIVPEAYLCVAPVQNMPFKSCGFDKVLCYGVFQCLDGWEDTLLELLRVCRPGGKILVGDIPSIRHRHIFYINSVMGLLSSFLNFRKLREKADYLQNRTPFQWLDLLEMEKFVKGQGFPCTVMKVPRCRQYDSLTYNYRLDLLIQKL